MSIEFRKLTGAGSAGKQEVRTPPVVLWIPPANKEFIEERLFHFLSSVCNGSPQATTPLLVEAETLQALYNNPHPHLILALQHCVDLLLVDLGPDPARWGTLELSTTTLGIALAAYNCLCPLRDTSAVEDPVLPFTTALIATLSPARTLSEMLAYHALLSHAAESLPFLSESRAMLMQALLNLSPLSAISYLHLHTPPSLTPLAAEFWPWWRPLVVSPAPWADLKDWMQALSLLLSQPILVTHLRRCWLSMPETVLASRNLGLLLEALRRRGDQRAIVLGFYEAFDYLCAVRVTNPWRGTTRRWPLLDHIERLLRADGNTEAAIQLNRLGNEYFSMFSPLIKIIIAEKGPPRDYYHLTPYLIQTLRVLLTFTTDAWVSRSQLQNVTFISEGEP